MFMDMAMLVETQVRRFSNWKLSSVNEGSYWWGFYLFQGEMVNSIENNVSNAAEYICSAKEETKKAVRYQKKSRRVCASLNDLLLKSQRNFAQVKYEHNPYVLLRSKTCSMHASMEVLNCKLNCQLRIAYYYSTTSIQKLRTPLFNIC